jgi:hypothetical protein
MVAVALVAALLLTVTASARAAPGDLDPTFGAGGIAPTAGLVGFVNALAVQPDGRIVAVSAGGRHRR